VVMAVFPLVVGGYWGCQVGWRARGGGGRIPLHIPSVRIMIEIEIALYLKGIQDNYKSKGA
jgi:hypothetical protein